MLKHLFRKRHDEWHNDIKQCKNCENGLRTKARGTLQTQLTTTEACILKTTYMLCLFITQIRDYTVS